MKPTGFPAPSAPVTIFLLRPSGYVARSTPIAGGDIIAVPRPRIPHIMSIEIGFGAKDVMREERLSSAMPRISWTLGPNRSAVLPKNRTNDPLERLPTN